MGKAYNNQPKNHLKPQSQLNNIHSTVFEEEEGYEDFGIRSDDLSRYMQHPSRYQKITCGKTGGSFDVPMRGRLEVEPGTFKRRETITFYILTADQRYQHEPIIKSRDDKLLSEVYRIQCSCRPKLPIRVRLSHHKLSDDYSKVSILNKDFSSRLWQSVDTAEILNDTEVLLDLSSRDAVYAVTCSPVAELFEVPQLGCLHMAKMNRIMQMRFPKTAVTGDIQCTIEMIPLRLTLIPQVFAQDILSVTDIVRLTPSVPGAAELRRAATIKLPLPQSTRSDQPPASPEDVGVYQMTQNGVWSLVESSVKLTKNSVSFDTKLVTQYCVAEVQPGRKQRACEALRLAHERHNAVRGDVITILRTDNKLWTLWMECVRSDNQTAAREKLSTVTGLRVLQRSLIPPSTTVRLSRTSVPSRKTSDAPIPFPDELLLINGNKFEFEMGGDLEFKQPECIGSTDDRYSLTYHDSMERNCRRMQVLPKSHIHQGSFKVKGELKIFSVDSSNVRNLIRMFEFDIDPKAVEDYFYVPPETEILETPKEQKRTTRIEDLINSSIPTAIEKKAQKTVVVQEKIRLTQNKATAMESIDRLSKPSRPIVSGISKESKVLSGRSLKALSSYIPNAIGLALQLRLTESSITGLTFDAAASQLSRDDVTYRLLLMWKRRTSGINSQAQVEMLVNGLEVMQWTDLARLVAERHRDKEELTDEYLSGASNKHVPHNSANINNHYRSKDDLKSPRPKSSRHRDPDCENGVDVMDLNDHRRNNGYDSNDVVDKPRTVEFRLPAIGLF